VSIDISNEALLPLRDAAASLPGRPHISTLHRWRLRGVRGIKLETVLVGGRRFTSQEALERFAANTTAASNGETNSPRTPKQRRQAIERAERQLALRDSVSSSDHMPRHSPET